MSMKNNKIYINDRVMRELISMMDINVSIEFKSNKSDEYIKSTLDKINILGGKVINLASSASSASSNGSDDKLILLSLKDRIIVISNKQLALRPDASELFSFHKVNKLSFDELDSSEVVKVNNMFYRSDINTLDISNLDLSKISAMEGMFMLCDIKNVIGFNKLKLNNIISLYETFNHSKIDNVDLSGISPEKTIEMVNTFYGCEINRVNLGDTASIGGIKNFHDSNIFVFCNIKQLIINENLYKKLYNSNNFKYSIVEKLILT